MCPCRNRDGMEGGLFWGWGERAVGRGGTAGWRHIWHCIVHPSMECQDPLCWNSQQLDYL